MNQLVAFLREVQVELKKVHWPSRDQTVRYTLVVLGMSAFIVVFLGGLDLLFSYLRNVLVFRQQ